MKTLKLVAVTAMMMSLSGCATLFGFAGEEMPDCPVSDADSVFCKPTVDVYLESANGVNIADMESGEQAYASDDENELSVSVSPIAKVRSPKSRLLAPGAIENEQDEKESMAVTHVDQESGRDIVQKEGKLTEEGRIEVLVAPFVDSDGVAYGHQRVFVKFGDRDWAIENKGIGSSIRYELR